MVSYMSELRKQMNKDLPLTDEQMEEVIDYLGHWGMLYHPDIKRLVTLGNSILTARLESTQLPVQSDDIEATDAIAQPAQPIKI